MTATAPRISLGPALKIWQGDNLEHLRYEYNLSFNDLVIDIGAYRGEFTKQIYNQYRCSIIAVEPTEFATDIPQREGKIKVINKAAATYDGTLRFGGGAYYTSKFEENSHEYPCLDINTLLESVGDIALLKINVEGMEYELLAHIINAGLHNKCRNIQVQFHCIDGEQYIKWYEQLSAALEETHELTWHYPFVWENWKIKEA